MTNLTPWVLLMPLLGFIILGLTGRVLSRTAILAVALGACGLAFLLAAFSFFSMLGTTPASARFSDHVNDSYRCGFPYTHILSRIYGRRSRLLALLLLHELFYFCDDTVGQRR